MNDQDCLSYSNSSNGSSSLTNPSKSNSEAANKINSRLHPRAPRIKKGFQSAHQVWRQANELSNNGKNTTTESNSLCTVKSEQASSWQSSTVQSLSGQAYVRQSSGRQADSRELYSGQTYNIEPAGKFGRRGKKSKFIRQQSNTMKNYYKTSFVKSGAKSNDQKNEGAGRTDAAAMCMTHRHQVKCHLYNNG